MADGSIRNIGEDMLGKDIELALHDQLPQLTEEELMEGVFGGVGYALGCVDQLAARGLLEDEGPWAWQREDGLTVTYTLNAINEITFTMQCPADEIVARIAAQEGGQ